MAKKSGIEIHDVKKFLAPLKCFNSSIKSLMFSVEDGTFSVNVGAPDISQVANLIYSEDTISVSDKKIENLTIYKLDEFITILGLFGQESITADLKDNMLTIHFNNKSSINYILGEDELADDMPSGPKVKLDFLAELEVNENFIKKIKTVSKSLSIDNLRFVCKDGVLSYIISGVHDNSHNYEEILIEECDEVEDFDIMFPIRTEHRDNFGFLVDAMTYTIGIHPLLLKFTAASDDYKKLEYFLAASERDDE